MIKTKTLSIRNQIDKYLLNQLSDQEIDDLWAEFLKYPALYDYFLTVVNLRAAFTDKSHLVNS